MTNRKIAGLAVLLLLLPSSALAQSVRYQSQVIGSRGLPLANQFVAVCQQPATISTIPCSPLATLGTSTSTISGGANPTTTDANGNFFFYLPNSAGKVTVQIYGPQITAPFVQPDIVPTPDLSGPVTFSGSLTPCSIAATQYVTTGGCNTTLAAAIAGLPAAGGIVDARGSGNLTIGSTVNVGTSSQAVRLLLGPYSYTVTSPAQIILGMNSELIGTGNGVLNFGSGTFPTLIQGNHTSAIVSVPATSDDVKIRNLRIDNTTNANAGGVGILGANGSKILIEDVSVSNLETGISLPATSTYDEIVRPEIVNSVKTGIKIVGNQNIVWGGRCLGGQVCIDIDGGVNKVIGTDLESATTVGVRIGNNAAIPSVRNEVYAGYTQSNAVDVQILNNQGGGSLNKVRGNVTITDSGVNTLIEGNVNTATTDTSAKYYNFAYIGTGDHEWITRNNGASGFMAWDDSQPAASRGWLALYQGGVYKLGVAAQNGVFTQAAAFNSSGFAGPLAAPLANGQGIQFIRTSTTCTTAASVGATCTTANITLPVAEADTNYAITCTGKGPSNVPVISSISNVSATQFTITIAALTAGAASYGLIDCVAGHN